LYCILKKSTQTDFCTAYSKKNTSFVLRTQKSTQKSTQKIGKKSWQKKAAKKDGKKVGTKYAKKVHCHKHNTHG